MHHAETHYSKPFLTAECDCGWAFTGKPWQTIEVKSAGRIHEWVSNGAWEHSQGVKVTGRRI